MNYFAQFGRSGTNMTNSNGKYSLSGITAGTQIGTMGKTGYASGVHAHMAVNGSEFGNKFYSINYPSNKTLNLKTQTDSYADYMTGYKYNNFYSNKYLWNNVNKYAKDSNLNYQDILNQHYLEFEYYKYLNFNALTK